MKVLQTPQEYPEPGDVRVRDTLLNIAKSSYFVHHFIILIYTIMLIFLEPKIFIDFTSSLILIIVYGFLALQLMLFNFFMIMLSKQIWAVWCNRFVAKMLIMLFPLFACFAFFHDRFLHLRSVKTFMGYYCFISIILIIYEIYSCTYGHHESPGFLYRPNDLKQHHDDVWTRRKEFKNQKKLRKTNSALE